MSENKRICLFIYKILTGVLFIFLSQRLYAHPHIFIENTLYLHFNGKGLAGIELKWIFDEIFSSMIISDCDSNKNKRTVLFF